MDMSIFPGPGNSLSFTRKATAEAEARVKLSVSSFVSFVCEVQSYSAYPRVRSTVPYFRFSLTWLHFVLFCYLIILLSVLHHFHVLKYSPALTLNTNPKTNSYSNPVMNYSEKSNLPGHREQTFECKDDQFILDAAEENGMYEY